MFLARHMGEAGIAILLVISKSLPLLLLANRPSV